jgi:hypothetical protein
MTPPRRARRQRHHRRLSKRWTWLSPRDFVQQGCSSIMTPQRGERRPRTSLPCHRHDTSESLHSLKPSKSCRTCTTRHIGTTSTTAPPKRHLCRISTHHTVEAPLFCHFSQPPPVMPPYIARSRRMSQQHHVVLVSASSLR